MGETGQRPLALIMARELAANLATPMFLIDPDGVLVFYNEAAEQIIGRPFGELGEVSALDFGEMLRLKSLDGTPLRRRDTPSGIAFFQRHPAHLSLQATSLDGDDRVVEVTAYPLFGKTDELHGVVTIFWPNARRDPAAAADG